MKKTVRMLNSVTTTLEHIFEMGKRIKDRGGLGFKGASVGTNRRNPIEATQKGKNHYRRRKMPLPALKCYLYRKLGHIRKECTHFLKHQKIRQQLRQFKMNQVWRIKRDGRCLVICTSLKMRVEEK